MLDLLKERGIPFLMATDLMLEEIPARHVDAPRLSKPYDLHELRRAVNKLAQGKRPTQLA